MKKIIFLFLILLSVNSYSSLSFNGWSNYATISGSLFNNLPNGTIECWVYFRTQTISAPYKGTILLKLNPNFLTVCWFATTIVSGSQSSFIFGLNDAGQLQSTIFIDDGKWYHLAATWDGVNWKMYINGALNNSTANSTVLTDNVRTTQIGCGFGEQAGYGADALIEDFRVYNIARTANQIAGDFKKKIGQYTNLYSYWKMNEGNGTKIWDKGTSINNGDIVGATWSNNISSPTREAPMTSNPQQMGWFRRLLSPSVCFAQEEITKKLLSSFEGFFVCKDSGVSDKIYNILNTLKIKTWGTAAELKKYQVDKGTPPVVEKHDRIYFYIPFESSVDYENAKSALSLIDKSEYLELIVYLNKNDDRAQENRIGSDNKKELLIKK